ncbi:MAG: pyridoxal-phosphate dependent enzyme [Longimicrobiales bacterium]|nr:pyridoxal-phosphate dependent enzyme [Longimicrobiales bacterium]
MTPTPLSRLEAWPRQPLASLPTPLVGAANLARALGPDSPSVCVKMDAETGFGLGGNKVRKLEFELGTDRLAGITHLVTTGGPQSNHCRITAAAAAHLGLGCVLVINGQAPAEPRGNALLQRLFGAEIRTVVARSDRAPAMAAAAEEIRSGGGCALVIPLGASTPLGSLGYALGAVELARQLDRLPAADGTWMFVSASSCGTLAGLLLGVSLLERDDIRLVGVSADVPAAEMRSEAVRLAAEGGGLLGWEGRVLADALSCDDTQVGPGYGIATPEAEEAIRIFGRSEGIVLDPVYTGKAAAGLLAWIREGRVPSAHRTVFVHTGGHPALLA